MQGTLTSGAVATTQSAICPFGVPDIFLRYLCHQDSGYMFSRLTGILTFRILLFSVDMSELS